MLKGGVPGILNTMVSGPALVLALSIAARSDPVPAEEVDVTVKVAASLSGAAHAHRWNKTRRRTDFIPNFAFLIDGGPRTEAGPRRCLRIPYLSLNVRGASRGFLGVRTGELGKAGEGSRKGVTVGQSCGGKRRSSCF